MAIEFIYFYKSFNSSVCVCALWSDHEFHWPILLSGQLKILRLPAFKLSGFSFIPILYVPINIIKIIIKKIWRETKQIKNRRLKIEHWKSKTKTTPFGRCGNLQEKLLIWQRWRCKNRQIIGSPVFMICILNLLPVCWHQNFPIDWCNNDDLVKCSIELYPNGKSPWREHHGDAIMKTLVAHRQYGSRPNEKNNNNERSIKTNGQKQKLAKRKTSAKKFTWSF